MLKKLKIYLIGTLLASMLFVPSCNLEEEILDEYTDETIQSDPNLLPNILAVPLAQVRKYWGRERIWGFMEATSDEAFFPTRGSDWLDGGVWQMNYTHTWTPTHRDVINTWNDLNSSISTANTAILNLGQESPDDPDYIWTYRAQAKFLRTFFEYYLYDLYRKYPARNAFDLDFLTPPPIFEGDAGFYRMVSILKTILPDMKDRSYVPIGTVDAYKTADYGEPDINSGLMLLAKLYLNKEVYVGISGYDSCLLYLNQLIDEGPFALAEDYFSMFEVNNNSRFESADDEGIFVSVFSDAAAYGNNNNIIWVQHTFHYNQTFGGNYGSNWNGVSSPESYLQSTWIEGTDTAVDARWVDKRYFDLWGINLGFNYGQQYNPATGDSLFDRNGNPLNYTFACNYDQAAEYEGVRVLKYPPRETVTNPERIENDFMIWRYADALLMQAECFARLGTDLAGAMNIVNTIRAKRNAPDVTASGQEEVLNKIYIERGLELYWEGHRRQDMIRFGTFLLPKTSKDFTSPETAILLPIPQAAIDGSEGTLDQNPGY
jgi:starch-binding outer membrane protein, SusD/RagB family